MLHALCVFWAAALFLLFTFPLTLSTDTNLETESNIKKILIVDDEKIFLLSLVEGLGDGASSLGRKFHFLTAGNGEKALKALESESIDLVITDLKMPVMDGFEFLSHMRKTYPDIPVIVISAFINSDVERRLSSLGVFHYLEKPFDLKDLVNWIQQTPWMRP